MIAAPLRILFTILSLIFSVCLGSQDVEAKEVVVSGKSTEDIYLQASLSTSKIVVGEHALLEVAVVSPSASLSLLEGPEHMDWKGLKVKGANPDSSFAPVEIKGKKMYRAVIGRWWISAQESGRFRIPEITYMLGIPKEKIVRDPFWGARRSTYYEPLQLSTPYISFRVDAIPEPPADFCFSGAVGDFAVNVWIPEGYISSGHEAIAMVSVSGPGNLEGAGIPSLKEAFSGTVRLKSLSEERNQYVKSGQLYSELEMEVTFIPHPDEEGNCSIGPIGFGFYSPTKNKFINVFSDSVKVPLGSSRKSKPLLDYGV